MVASFATTAWADVSVTYTYEAVPTTVPEPTTMIVWGLLGVVAAGFGAWRRKRAG
jgi:hypothetical protein